MCHIFYCPKIGYIVVAIFEPLYRYLRLSTSSGFFHQIVDFSTKSSLVYQKLFCLAVLPVIEQHFHFGSDTSDYITMLGDENKHSIITGWFTEQNLVLTAPFNNMRNLKLKSSPTVAFSVPSINIAEVLEND